MPSWFNLPLACVPMVSIPVLPCTLIGAVNTLETILKLTMEKPCNNGSGNSFRFQPNCPASGPRVLGRSVSWWTSCCHIPWMWVSNGSTSYRSQLPLILFVTSWPSPLLAKNCHTLVGLGRVFFALNRNHILQKRVRRSCNSKGFISVREYDPPLREETLSFGEVNFTAFGIKSFIR